MNECSPSKSSFKLFSEPSIFSSGVGNVLQINQINNGKIFSSLIISCLLYETNEKS